jgi:hypothetical protein
MENYFNYFTEIEEHFQKRRGKATLLSPLDWSLIESFQQAGIPIGIVLRGVDRAFDKFEQRKNRFRQINSLAYCTQAILAEYERQKESTVGKTKEFGMSEADNVEDRENISRLIGEAVERLKIAIARLRGQPPDSPVEVLEHIQNSLLNIGKEVASEQRLDYESLELRLGTMEEKIFASFIATLSDEALLALRSQVSQEIRRHKRGLKSEHIAMLERKMLVRKIFDQFGVPRLSLFYLPLN